VSLQTQLAEIAEAVAVARRAVADGALIEISGLDGAVTEICGGADIVPAAERGSFAENLAALADALDQLAAEIVRQGEAARRRQAADAYRDGG
jgi:hypothetical protein